MITQRARLRLSIVLLVGSFAFLGYAIFRTAGEESIPEVPEYSPLGPLLPPMRGVEESAQLLIFTLRTMDIVGSPLSPFRRELVARQIVDTAIRRLRTTETRQAYVLLLGIESKFDPAARSRAGAVGIAQLMPKYMLTFAEACGILPTSLREGDISSLEGNLEVSACHFAGLLSATGGSIPLALAAYNSGLYSKTTKDYGRLHDMNTETSNYVARFTLVGSRVHSVSQIPYAAGGVK